MVDGVREAEREGGHSSSQAHRGRRRVVLSCRPCRGIVEHDRPRRRATIGAGTAPEVQRRSRIGERQAAADRDRPTHTEWARARKRVVVCRTVDRRIVVKRSSLHTAAAHEDRIAGPECRVLHPKTLGAAEARVVVEQEILGAIAATLEVGVAAIPATVHGVVDDDVVGEGTARARQRHDGSGLRVTGGVDGQRQPRLERLYLQRRFSPPAGGSFQSGGRLSVSASGTGGRKQLGDERGHQIGRP